jgi:hypothetical protein
MTTNLLAAGNSALARPAEASTLLGVEEDQLAGRGRMVRTTERSYKERQVKPRFAARADKAAREPEPREERRGYGRE